MRTIHILLVAAVLTLSACASVDSFNKLSADVVRDAITATEENRCTVHAPPCLDDAQFKAVNLQLYRVSTAGAVFTKLRLIGAASPADVATFLTTVSSAVAELSQAFPDGRLATVLRKLTDLQSRALDLLG